MALNITTIDPILKVLQQGSLTNQVYKKFPLFALIPKQSGFSGRHWVMPAQYSNGGSRSALVGTAKDNVAAPGLEDFQIPRVSDYSYGQITAEAIEASADNTGAFVRGLQMHLDSKMRELMRGVEIALFRDGTGWICDVHASTAATATVLTLDYPESGALFEVNDELVVCPDTAASLHRTALTLAGTTDTVTGVNRATGELTTNDDWTAGAAYTASDHIFVEDDRIDGAVTTWALHRKLVGLMAWMSPNDVGHPMYDDGVNTAYIDEAASPFFGVDRQVDSRLAGQYLDATTYSLVEEALIDAVNMSAAEGATPNVIFVNPKYFKRLQKELGSKVQYDKLQAQGPKGKMAKIGFSGIKIDGPGGNDVAVIQNIFCPAQYGFCLDTSSLQLKTLGAMPKFLKHDGNKILRMAISSGDADVNHEFVCAARGNLGCKFAGGNVTIMMPT